MNLDGRNVWGIDLSLTDPDWVSWFDYSICRAFHFVHRHRDILFNAAGLHISPTDRRTHACTYWFWMPFWFNVTKSNPIIVLDDSGLPRRVLKYLFLIPSPLRAYCIHTFGAWSTTRPLVEQRSHKIPYGIATVQLGVGCAFVWLSPWGLGGSDILIFLILAG